jgi:hypothetical protein
MSDNIHPQAHFLRGLADHIERHPHLGGVVVHWTIWSDACVDLQIIDNGPAPVAEWARSLNSTHLAVRTDKPRNWLHLHADGELGGRPVRVWAAAYELLDQHADGDRIPVDRLDGGAQHEETS